jgi:predicted ATP-dependent serine protease
MVQAMVETHAQGTRSTTGLTQDNVEVDLVRGKGRSRSLTPAANTDGIASGKGCIILLHGAPGVGKTSTAGETKHSFQLVLG